MPELPEVETVARGLRAVLPGRRFLSLRLGKTDFIEDPAAIEQMLPGCQVTAVRRHGKFLVLDLVSARADNGHSSLLIHLGMTGRLVVCPAEAPVIAHTHVFLPLDDGRELRYTDIRRFGRMRIVADSARESILGELGLDPLEASEEEFSAKLRGRRARIKALLLDQRQGEHDYVGAVTMRLAASLKPRELRNLHRAVRAVLLEAIRLRGSSISDYVDSEGQRGEFQLRHRVYQRTGKKCFRCGTKIRRAIIAGRSSHFCPRCQPAPRLRRPRRSNKSSRQD